MKLKVGSFEFSFREKRGFDIGYGNGWKREDKGTVVTSYQWTDRQPHPENMKNYEKWANDPEANIAFNVLTDIISGVGYYTEMPEEVDAKHKNKKIIDDYSERVNLDEDLQEIVMAMLQKGFCPVQRLSDYDLHILPPETFFIWMTKTGTVYRYTQERSTGDVIRIWEAPDWRRYLKECKEAYDSKMHKELMEYTPPRDIKPGKFEDLILFFHRRTTSRPYGKSLTEPIGALLDDRTKMNEDMPKAIHRWAYPIPIMETDRDREPLQKVCEDRDLDDWIFIGKVKEGEVRWKTLEINPQARFIPYIELIYYQICEGLHAPLLLYLKDATEASATVMMESVDRLVNGIQRYVKRRVERYLFEPQCGEPVPRLMWGQPKTGLEEVTLADVAAVFPYLARNQRDDLLRKLGLDIIEPELEPAQPTPQLPFQKPMQMPPLEKIIERMNDLSTQLNVIEVNFNENKIGLVKAVRIGGEAIDAHCKRLYGQNEALFEEQRTQEFKKWIERLNSKKQKGTVYQVSVSD